MRYVGEPLAMVVAEDAHAAQDAAELIVAEIEPMPRWSTRRRRSPPMRRVCTTGTPTSASTGALATTRPRSGRSQRRRPRRPRAGGEQSRGGRGHGAARGGRRLRAGARRFTLHVGCQGVFGLRRTLAEDLLRIEPERLRVLAYDVGGSFGMKAAAYPEYVGILHAARALGRPVKWCDERSGSFSRTSKGGARSSRASWRSTPDGNFLAVRVRNLADMGAYLTAVGPMMPAVNMQKNLPSLYRTPIVAISTRCVFTNTVPIGPYRGAGRPEANYVMERLVDAAARATGRDPAALRRQNLIPGTRCPTSAPSGLEYDSGDFARRPRRRLAQGGLGRVRSRRDASEAKGTLRGPRPRLLSRGDRAAQVRRWAASASSRTGG